MCINHHLAFHAKGIHPNYPGWYKSGLSKSVSRADVTLLCIVQYDNYALTIEFGGYVIQTLYLGKNCYFPIFHILTQNFRSKLLKTFLAIFQFPYGCRKPFFSFIEDTCHSSSQTQLMYFAINVYKRLKN